MKPTAHFAKSLIPALVVGGTAFAAQAQSQTEPTVAPNAPGPGAPVSAGRTPLGVWRTQDGRSHIRLYACGTKLCGRIVWLREPNWTDGKPLVDKRNPDPKLRDRPVLGLKVVWGFSRSERPGRWDGGRMYHPEEGKIYKGALTLRTDGRLRVRGYRKVPVVGKTQYWTRVAPSPTE